MLTRHEGKTLEFKRDASSPAGIVRTIVAFANSAGGTVLVGVADRTRDVVGVADPLDAEERLANIVVDSIEPRIAPQIEILPWRDTAVVAIRVHPGSGRPYHVAREGAADGVYVRVGSTNRRADAWMIQEMQRSARGAAFDEEPVPGEGIDAIDSEAVAAAFAGIRRIDDRALATLRLVCKYDGAIVPTVGGILLFGARRLDRFPDAIIEAARFAGSTRSTFVDSAAFDGPLPVAFEHAMAFVRRNIARGFRIEGARRAESWEYPQVAIRELLANAVVHADYSLPGLRVRVAIFDDRIEIESPGLLMSGLTIADLVSGVSRTRNRVIARVFRELGVIEQWGTGIPRAVEACRDAGLADPEFEEFASVLRVTIRSQRGEAGVDRLDADVLKLLDDSEGLSTAAIAARIQRTPRATRDRLRSLVDAGLVVEVGSSPNDPHRTYHIAQDRPPYRVR